MNDIFWQHSQRLMYSLTYSRRYFQGFFFSLLSKSDKLFTVLSMPWWPTILLCTRWRVGMYSFGISNSTVPKTLSVLPKLFTVSNAAQPTIEHNLLKPSATIFLCPGMCSTSKLYSCISSFQRRTLLVLSFMYSRFWWSVLSVNFMSLIKCFNFLKE